MSENKSYASCTDSSRSYKRRLVDGIRQPSPGPALVAETKTKTRRITLCACPPVLHRLCETPACILPKRQEVHKTAMRGWHSAVAVWRWLPTATCSSSECGALARLKTLRPRQRTARRLRCLRWQVTVVAQTEAARCVRRGCALSCCAALR